MQKCTISSQGATVNKTLKASRRKGFLSRPISKSDKMREEAHQRGEKPFRDASSASPSSTLVFFLFFLFHPFICSSISVSHPLPLPVCLSSLNKQTRSSCQLWPTPRPRLSQSPLAPMASEICNFLTCRLQEPRIVHCGVGASWKPTWSDSSGSL